MEGHTQSIRLDDVEPRVFGLLVDWVHSQYLRDECGATLMELARLWTLGERFIMPRLQNAAMKDLCWALAMAKSEDILEYANYVYEISAIEDTMLKRVAVGRVAFRELKEVEGLLEGIPKEMHIQVTKALYIRFENLQRNANPCDKLDTELNFRHFLVGEEEEGEDLEEEEESDSSDEDEEVEEEPAPTGNTPRGANLGWSIGGGHLATLT